MGGLSTRTKGLDAFVPVGVDLVLRGLLGVEARAVVARVGGGGRFRFGRHGLVGGVWGGGSLWFGFGGGAYVWVGGLEGIGGWGRGRARRAGQPTARRRLAPPAPPAGHGGRGGAPGLLAVGLHRGGAQTAFPPTLFMDDDDAGQGKPHHSHPQGQAPCAKDHAAACPCCSCPGRARPPGAGLGIPLCASLGPWGCAFFSRAPFCAPPKKFEGWLVLLAPKYPQLPIPPLQGNTQWCHSAREGATLKPMYHRRGRRERKGYHTRRRNQRVVCLGCCPRRRNFGANWKDYGPKPPRVVLLFISCCFCGEWCVVGVGLPAAMAGCSRWVLHTVSLSFTTLSNQIISPPVATASAQTDWLVLPARRVPPAPPPAAP